LAAACVGAGVVGARSRGIYAPLLMRGLVNARTIGRDVPAPAEQLERGHRRSGRRARRSVARADGGGDDGDER
jgi:hypothetical protein